MHLKGNQKIKGRNKEPTAVAEEETERPKLTNQKLFEILDEPSIHFEGNESTMETNDYANRQTKGKYYS